MPRPFATKSGLYYLNVKVKTALRDTARGRTLTLPIGDSHATVTVTDKVFVSLRTKDPETAKTRFRLAMHYFSVHTSPGGRCRSASASGTASGSASTG